MRRKKGHENQKSPPETNTIQWEDVHFRNLAAENGFLSPVSRGAQEFACCLGRLQNHLSSNLTPQNATE